MGVQAALFYESFNEALGEVIRACGGVKPVACRLWPEKTPDAAHRQLLACLNEGRPEKLNPEQVILMLCWGREKGCHAGINYVANVAGYANPAPVEPEDERAALQRQFIEASKALQSMVQRMAGLGVQL